MLGLPPGVARCSISRRADLATGSLQSARHATSCSPDRDGRSPSQSSDRPGRATVAPALPSPGSHPGGRAIHRLLHLLLLLLLLTACPSADPLDDDDASNDHDAANDDDSSGDDDDTPSWQDCPAPVVEDPAPDLSDCNDDGLLDSAQLADGSSVDCNGDGVLDECQTLDDACVTYGAREFIEYDAGSLPIVLSAPHGGQVSPEDIPDRVGASTGSDTNTIQLARAIDAALLERTGFHAHLVLCQLHRHKLECNRSLDEAQDGHPETVAAWTEYHAFIDAAKRTAEAQFGRALYVDLHGLAATRDKNELGYLLYPSQLYEDDARLAHPGYARRSSIRAVASETDGDLVEALRGTTSLGAHLQSAGFDSVPSPQFPDPGYDENGEPGNYFNGGYNTRRHGSRDGGTVDGLQIETMWTGVRDSEANRAAFADAVADGLLLWVEDHQGVSPRAENLVRVGPVSGFASERGAEATVPIRRVGDLGAPLEVELLWGGDTGDVQPLPSVASFAAGESEVLVTVSALADGVEEGGERVSLELLGGSGHNLAPDAHTASVHVADAERSSLWRVEAPTSLTEGAAAELRLYRDGCGYEQVVEVATGGDVEDDEIAIDAAGFGASEASVEVSFEPVADGEVEGVEALVLAFAVEGGGLDVALRLLDAERDPTLLAGYDGRVADGQLVEGGSEPWPAEMVPHGDAGPTAQSDGPAGPYLGFDEVDDAVIVDDIGLDGAFTVAFGFRASSASSDGYRYLYGHGNINGAHHLNVYLTDAGTVRTSLRGADDASDFSALDVTGGYRDDAWHHVAVVVAPSGPSTTVWLDGVALATAPRGGSTFDPDHPIILGSRWDLSPTRHYRGDLDEIRIHDGAMTPSEIQGLAAPFVGGR